MISFSIIVPTYNRADLIPRTIKSILSQSYPHFELIIVDDGSTDNTREIVLNFRDNRIQYVYIENSERGKARNTGTALAKGDYITFIDSDDIVYSNHLLEALNMIEKYKNPEIFHLGYEIKNNENVVLVRINNRTGNLNKALIKGNSLSCIGCFLRRDIAINNLFEEDRELAGSEDWLLWLKLAARFPIYYSNTITSSMVDHNNRSVNQFNEAKSIRKMSKLIYYLSKDSLFINSFGRNAITRIEAHMHTYISLHAALANETFLSLKYFVKGIIINPFEFFTRRTLAIAKNILLNIVKFVIR